MEVKRRKPGTRITGKLYLRKPKNEDGTPGDLYDLTEAENWTVHFYLIDGKQRQILLQLSREELDGYTVLDQTGADPTAGEVKFILEGEKTKSLYDQMVYVEYNLQFKDGIKDFWIGAEEGVNTEFVKITNAAKPVIPAA